MNYSERNNKKRWRRHSSHLSHGKRVKNKIGFIVLRVFIAAFLIGCFALAGAGIGAYLGVIQGAPELPPVGTFMIYQEDSIIFDAYGNEIDRLDAGESREFVPLSHIPEHVWQAFIAIEDERFFEHDGVDTRAVARAIYQTMIRDNVQGGSTITQQLVKNMRGFMSNTIESKLQEMYLAIQLEIELTEELGCRMLAKEFILESYLNMVALGHGNLGVQAAARFYFDKDVSELTISEAAVLAAILPNPTAFSPVNFPDNNRRRQVFVLNNMLEQGMITPAEHGIAMADEVHVRIMQFDPIFQVQGRVRSYFADAVITQVRMDLRDQLGLTNQQANALIWGGGIQIHTTMLPWVQEVLDDTFTSEDHGLFPTDPRDFFYSIQYSAIVVNSITEVRRTVHRSSRGSWETANPPRFVRTHEQIQDFVEWARDDILGPDDTIVRETVLYSPQPQASMIIVDHNNGHVVGMAGGRGEKQTDLAFNRATGAQRQPGSVFKMFVYAAAFDMGMITAATTFDDTPNIIFDWGRGDYRSWPRNHWGGQFRGYSSVRRAVEMSYNVVAVKAMNDTIGLDAMMNYLYRFGFTTLTERDAVDAIVLGGIDGITNLEITAAFGAMANGGIMHDTILYTRVYDRNGNILLENLYQPRMVLNRNAAYLLTDTMRGVIDGRGTGGAARFRDVRMDTAGKTGTTEYARDVYFVGYTPYFTAGVWVGYDHPRAMSTRITGQRVDARIWRHVMEEIHRNLEYRRFEQPPGFVRAQVCSVSGLLVNEGVCNHDPRGLLVRTELFAPGTVPTRVCDIHMTFTVCNITGRIPGHFCLPHTVEFRGGIIRDRSFMEVTGNVGINDAHAEVPPDVLAGLVCDGSCRFGFDYDYYGFVPDWMRDILIDPPTEGDEEFYILYIPDNLPPWTPPYTQYDPPSPPTVDLPTINFPTIQDPPHTPPVEQYMPQPTPDPMVEQNDPPVGLPIID